MGAGYSTKDLANRKLGNEVDISINGKTYKVTDDVPADTTLNTFIREYAHLKGTKFMCLEGGCGTCIVSVESIYPGTGKPWTYAVNSCLIPVFACHGWAITTIDGLGDKSRGYNKISKRLAAASGTQCGYCSPGMVMNMYSLLKTNPNITMKEVENSFGGNICRCTGYRPILDAFKSFATDAPNQLKEKLQDIEDILCPKDGRLCTNSTCLNDCSRIPDKRQEGLHLQLTDGSSWFRPVNKKEIFEILDMIGDKSYRLIAGNTGNGVYRYTSEPEVYIDLNGIPELHTIEVSAEGITMGANVNLTQAMDLFYKKAKEEPKKFSYCQTLADHIDLIANVPVRNAGTLGGNLFMKYVHHEFPSDVFLILEMVGAQLIIADSSGMETQVEFLEFLQLDMKRKLIFKIILPTLDSSVYLTRSFKIMPRAQNAHAYINAGFKFKLDPKTHMVLEKPSVLFGGINPSFLHASKTEDFLKDKKLINETTLKSALEILQSELSPDHELPDATPEYRKGLAMSLFYKFVLGVAPNEVNEVYKSGGSLLQRSISSGKQDFDTDSSVWPLNKPIPKIEGLMQCAGETEYVNDIGNIPGEVWGQLVICDRARAVIAKIDPSEALKLKGVLAFYTAEDIPGKNNYFPKNFFESQDEVVFSEGRTNYAGEAVGVIIAERYALALKAAKLVKIEYSDPEKPVISCRDIINNKLTDRITDGPNNLEPKRQGKDVKFKITGEINLPTQYHYTMEPLTCLVVPKENEFDVYPTAQWPSAVHESISQFLNVPQNKINVHVRRVGGGYGGKISRICHTACVASLGAYHLKRPVRMIPNLETTMEWIGKRCAVSSDYELGVDSEGVIQYMNIKIYQNDGQVLNDSAMSLTTSHTINCYDSSTWSIKNYNLKTDLAGTTWCRAPSSTEAVFIIENIMEHISNTVGKCPIQVRLSNMDKKDNPLPELVDEMKKISEYEKRVKEIEEFNKLNRWKKRGISLVTMRYPVSIYGYFHATVSIFGNDGSVSITHGGVEMGQGINTKVVQVAAHVLGIDTWRISTKPYNVNVCPNDASTGGSIGSECVAFAVQKCCELLNEKLKPIKEELGDKATWEEICKKAYVSLVDLMQTYMEKPFEIKDYYVYGVSILEVEVDILTGQYHTRRVDILEDAGRSMSPEVDIGQIEGAFIMGLGYYTCEEIVYNTETGRCLTNRTWNYKPPGAKDIPMDFRVTLRKNAPNPFGVLKSKATGEPPFCMTCGVVFSIRNALESARKDSGIKQEIWFDLDQPCTAERIWMGALTKKEMFKL